MPLAKAGDIELSYDRSDQLIQVAHGYIVAELIPGSRLEILEGAGHMFFLERPERTAQLLREHALVNA